MDNREQKETKPRYENNFSSAMDKLSAPSNDRWDAVEQVKLPYNTYIAGPRPAAPMFKNGQLFRTGGGSEYRIGGFGDWEHYFKNWFMYIVWIRNKLFAS